MAMQATTRIIYKRRYSQQPVTAEKKERIARQLAKLIVQRIIADNPDLLPAGQQWKEEIAVSRSSDAPSTCAVAPAAQSTDDRENSVEWSNLNDNWSI
ncbi:MAG: hypothetical protein ACYDBB_16240 [Armatimonadota bacterium]